MRISEVIKELQGYLEVYGDLQMQVAGHPGEIGSDITKEVFDVRRKTRMVPWKGSFKEEELPEKMLFLEDW